MPNIPQNPIAIIPTGALLPKEITKDINDTIKYTLFNLSHFVC